MNVAKASHSSQHSWESGAARIATSATGSAITPKLGWVCEGDRSNLEGPLPCVGERMWPGD